MRRILLFVTDLEIGGTPAVVRELAVRLNRPPAVRVEVACLSAWGPVADQLRDRGVRVTALDAAGPRDVGAARRFVRLVAWREYDTVFSFLVHANAVAAWASRGLPGVRWLQSIQTTQPGPRWHWSVQRAAQHAAERVVVPSDSAAGAARDRADVPAEKIVVIPNAVDTVGPLSFVPLTDPRPYPIGFVGRLDPVKRVPDLVRAVALLDGLAHLHVYGGGPERAAIGLLVTGLGLSRSVTLHGAVSRADPFLPGLGLLVLPSAAEGFGLVLIEAMAARVPVVATNVPGIRDVVRDGETGLLVPPGSPPALADAIRRIIENRRLRLRLTDGGAARVEREFDWRVVLHAYRRLLRIDG